MHACVVQDLMMLGTQFGERFQEPSKERAGFSTHHAMDKFEEQQELS